MSDTAAWFMAVAFWGGGVVCLLRREYWAAGLCLLAAIIFNGVLR